MLRHDELPLGERPRVAARVAARPRCPVALAVLVVALRPLRRPGDKALARRLHPRARDEVVDVEGQPSKVWSRRARAKRRKVFTRVQALRVVATAAPPCEDGVHLRRDEGGAARGALPTSKHEPAANPREAHQALARSD